MEKIASILMSAGGVLLIGAGITILRNPKKDVTKWAVSGLALILTSAALIML